MDHINVLLHFISFVSGISFIALSYAFYAKSKSQLLKLIITADMLYTILLVIDSLAIYIRKNSVEHYEALHTIATSGQFIIGFTFLYYLTRIIYHLIGDHPLPKPKMIYLLLLIVPLLFILLSLVNILWIPYINPIYITNSYLCALLIYMITILVHHISKMSDPIKIVVANCLGTIFLILPLWLITTIFDFLPLFMYKIPYTPLLYFSLNMIGLHRLKKHIFTQETTKKISEEVIPLLGKDEVITIFDTLHTTYHITERENEIINSIIQGNSNQTISTQLFISLNTVKNHIYHIYQKMGIKNRYELINLIAKLKK